MVLSKKHILQRIKHKELNFLPMIDGFQLQPHSVDLRLGYDFHLPRIWDLTPKGRQALNIDPFLPNINKNFEKIVLTLEVDCTYHELGGFVSRLENFPRFIKISSLKASKLMDLNNSRPDELKVSMSVSIFYPLKELEVLIK